MAHFHSQTTRVFWGADGKTRNGFKFKIKEKK